MTGQEQVLTTIEGRKVKSIFRIEGHILIENQIEPNREVTIIREFYEKEFLGSSIVGNVTCKNRGVLEEWIEFLIKLIRNVLCSHVFYRDFSEKLNTKIKNNKILSATGAVS